MPASLVAAALISLAAALWVVSPQPFRQDGDETTGPIARSGVVEVNQISIHRQKTAYAAKGAELTYMSLALWLPVVKSGRTGEEYLVRLTELAPIKDETGKQLSTKARLEAIPELKDDTQADESAGVGGSSGPILMLTLDAPARGAAHLKLVKGKATVQRVMNETLHFEGLAKLAGKPLEHQRLKGYQITPSLEIKNASVEVSLRVPSRRGRLMNWSLTTRGGRLSPDSQGWSTEKEGGVLSQSYHGIGSKDVETAALELNVAVPVETKTLTFEFQNLELP
jgi:hypothetical protein